MSLTKQHLQNSHKPHSASLSLLHALNRTSNPNTPHVFGVLILALSQLGLIDEALFVFKNLDPLPPLRVCNALLHGLVKSQRFVSVWEVYGNMVSRGFSPTIITYGILMQCCCINGDFSNARKVFGEMLQ